MILVDSNILVYAYVTSSPAHEQSRTWLDACLSGTARVGLPWISLVAFLRIVTNPRIYEHPMDIRGAWRQVTAWLGNDLVWTPGPTDRHAAILGKLIERYGITSTLVTDAHLAALAIEHGLTLCSADGDFARFKELRWQNPLA